MNLPNVYISIEGMGLKTTIMEGRNSSEAYHNEPMMIVLDYMNQEHMEVYHSVQKEAA